MHGYFIDQDTKAQKGPLIHLRSNIQWVWTRLPLSGCTFFFPRRWKSPHNLALIAALFWRVTASGCHLKVSQAEVFQQPFVHHPIPLKGYAGVPTRLLWLRPAILLGLPDALTTPSTHFKYLIMGIRIGKLFFLCCICFLYRIMWNGF